MLPFVRSFALPLDNLEEKRIFEKRKFFFFKLNYNKRKRTLTRSEFICKIRDHQEVGNNSSRVVAEQRHHVGVSVEAGDFPVYPF